MAVEASFFAGIDPCGGRKPFLWAAFDRSGRLTALEEGDLEEAVNFVTGLPSVWVAVNAPPRLAQGVVTRQMAHQQLPALRGVARAPEMRLAEYLLRERGINVTPTPSRRALSPNWMQLGFLLYERLERAGFAPYPAPTALRVWMETQPHAVFCALLGQAPLSRPTLEGRLQRQLVLYQQGFGLRDPMIFFEELTRHKLLKGLLPLEQVYAPEQLDTLAAAATAWLVARHPERSLRLGDPEEGQIILPVAELRARY